VPRALPPEFLAQYEGRYTGLIIPTEGVPSDNLPDGLEDIPPLDTPNEIEELSIELRADNGGLRVRGDLDLSLAFYRDEYALTTDPAGQLSRSDFVRGPDGGVAWFRNRGRLYRHEA
jgi:hypothetical protein